MRNKKISIKIKRLGLKNTIVFPQLNSSLIDLYNWSQILFWEIISADSCSLFFISKIIEFCQNNLKIIF